MLSSLTCPDYIDIGVVYHESVRPYVRYCNGVGLCTPSLILYDTQGLEILASIHESAEKYEWY